ncbi:Uncharacterised protein [Escherichia coli]|nr:Uncharacterised protein [Escherichia coli]
MNMYQYCRMFVVIAEVLLLATTTSSQAATVTKPTARLSGLYGCSNSIIVQSTQSVWILHRIKSCNTRSSAFLVIIGTKIKVMRRYSLKQCLHFLRKSSLHVRPAKSE